MNIKTHYSEVAIQKVTTGTNISIPEPTRGTKNTETNISYDKDANLFVVKVIDRNSISGKEVVMQYPPEEMLNIAKELGKTQGLVINEKS